jgi:ankyrin repeat protein
MRGELAICEFLVAEQCPWSTEACEEAARGGHLEIVRLLRESGCPWDVHTICEQAAESGSVEVLQYLVQQGCILTSEVTCAAADEGYTQLCKFLRGEQCPWDAIACRSAALNGHVDTLRWLREHGAPFDTQEVRIAAAESGEVPTIEYALNAEPAASAAQLTDMLNAAGVYDWIVAAKWLRQQGAEWPAVLRFSFADWSGNVLQWARAEGCTSPTG